MQTYDELLADSFEIVEAGETPTSYGKRGAVYTGLYKEVAHNAGVTIKTEGLSPQCTFCF